MLVKQKIRSGQRIHARGRDLIVLGSVSNGAEIIVDGHIHVYGTLYGRAIAGESSPPIKIPQRNLKNSSSPAENGMSAAKSGAQNKEKNKKRKFFLNMNTFQIKDVAVNDLPVVYASNLVPKSRQQKL